MAQQNINYGAVANDGTGDSLRLSQIKAQANFTDLYANKDANLIEQINTFDGTPLAIVDKVVTLPEILGEVHLEYSFDYNAAAVIANPDQIFTVPDSAKITSVHVQGSDYRRGIEWGVYSATEFQILVDLDLDDYIKAMVSTTTATLSGLTPQQETDLSNAVDKRLLNVVSDLSLAEQDAIKEKIGVADREIKLFTDDSYLFELEDKNKILLTGNADFIAQIPIDLFASGNKIIIHNGYNDTDFTIDGSLLGSFYSSETTTKIKGGGTAEILFISPSVATISGDLVSDGTIAAYDDTALTLIAKTDVISYALSSPTGDLAAGDADSFMCPYDLTLNNFIAAVSEAPTGSALVIGLKKNTVSVTSSNAIMDSGEFTTLTGTAPTITTSSFLKGDLITPTIQQVGSLTTGKSLKIYLEITKL